MLSVRGRSALALLIVIALVALFALPALAFADESVVATSEVTETTAAETVETAPPAEVTAPSAQAETAVEEAPVPETVPASTEAAPQAVQAVSKTPAASLGSSFTTGALGRRAVAAAKAAAAKQNANKPARASGKVAQLSRPGDDCSGTVANYGLTAPAVTPVMVGSVPSTQFAWTITYGPTDGCENETLSHISLIPCLVANGGNFTDDEYTSNGWYKWDDENVLQKDYVLTLTFPGTVASGTSTSFSTSLVKGGLESTPAVAGPLCTTQGGCATYTLATAVLSSPAGASGTVGVSSNDGDSPWTVGETVSLDAPTIPGYTFSGWTGDRTGSSDPLSVTFATTDTDCVVSVTANYTENSGGCETYELTTTVLPAAGGSISGAGTNPHAGDSFVDLTATPNSGYTFSGWSGDGTGATTRRVSFTGSDCDLSVTANFAEIIITTTDCNGDTDATNNGPNGDCTIPLSPDCSGDFDSTNNGPNGDCTEEPTDVCPNIDDAQTEVPEGMVINPVTGDCEEDEVLGEIIERDPKPSKPEPKPEVEPQAVAPQVLGKAEPKAGMLPFTGSDLLPFLLVAGLLMALGTALTVRRTAEARK